MSDSYSSPNIDQLRTELAVLQEDITDTSNPPTRAKFKIPVLITDNTTGTMYTSNSNITNRSNNRVSSVTLDDTIELPLPKEHVVYYGKKKMPAGTRFIITFVSANINDIRIIGRYDNIDD